MSDIEDLARVRRLYPKLSIRDVHVWREIVRGGSNQQIASTLSLSVDTVKTYLRRLYDRLPIPRDRTALAIHGLRTGLFTLAPYDLSSMQRPLTLIEVQVVKGVADGMSNTQIAAARGVSALTVKSHLARIGVALDAHSRTSMATRCYRAGLIK